MHTNISPSTLKRVLAHCFNLNMNILITGRPGIGKSEIVESAAKEAGVEFMVSHPTVSDPVDYKGLPFMGEDGVAHFAPFNDLQALIDADKKTVFFLDDLGQASPAVQAAAMQLLQARRINGHMVSDHVVFVAATNRREDRAAVRGILEPVKSRFTILNLEPTVNDWVDWALGTDWVPIEIIGAAKFKPQWLTEWEPASKGAIANSPCPRNLIEVAKMMVNRIDDDLRLPMFAGRMGQGAAIELIAYLDLYKDLPSIKTIADDPYAAPIPSNPSAKYAFIGKLFEAATSSNYGKLLKYVDRMPVEFAVLFNHYIARRKSDLQSCPEFIEWAVKNMDVIL